MSDPAEQAELEMRRVASKCAREVLRLRRRMHILIGMWVGQAILLSVLIVVSVLHRNWIASVVNLALVVFAAYQVGYHWANRAIVQEILHAAQRVMARDHEAHVYWTRMDELLMKLAKR